MLDQLLQILDEPLGVCEGLVLSVMTLRRVLGKLTGERGGWWLEEPLVTHLGDDNLPMIQVFHCLSGPDQVTDELSFLVPVIGDPNRSDRSLVCFVPELLQPFMEGLYLEDGRVVGDFVTDFERFWSPLKNALLQFGTQEGAI